MIDSKRSEILSVARKHGAFNVAVFGSVARREADEKSDVDLLVDLEPGRSLLDLGGLQVELEELLGRPVDVVTRAGVKARIRERVLSEATPLREIQSGPDAARYGEYTAHKGSRSEGLRRRPRLSLCGTD